MRRDRCGPPAGRPHVGSGRRSGSGPGCRSGRGDERRSGVGGERSGGPRRSVGLASRSSGPGMGGESRASVKQGTVRARESFVLRHVSLWIAQFGLDREGHSVRDCRPGSKIERRWEGRFEAPSACSASRRLRSDQDVGQPLDPAGDGLAAGPYGSGRPSSRPRLVRAMRAVRGFADRLERSGETTRGQAPTSTKRGPSRSGGPRFSCAREVRPARRERRARRTGRTPSAGRRAGSRSGRRPDASVQSVSRRASSASITALIASASWAPRRAMPLMKKAGVPVTPAASPAAKSRSTNSR